MGRELRRVIPNWEHPKVKEYSFRRQENIECYHPMMDESYVDAINEWIKNHRLWEKGKYPDQSKDSKYYAEWAGDAPELKYYRPDWKKEDMTWYQVYETVSEGTPVTPPFESKKELIEYLTVNGDYWDQDRRKDGGSVMSCEPWTREDAENFVNNTEWAPSGMIVNGQYMSGIRGLAKANKKEEG